jgi:hypothetical protein
MPGAAALPVPTALVYRRLMANWGWALLTTRPRLVEWHKVLMTQDTERESWVRYLTACRLNLEAEEIAPHAAAGRGPVCSICLSAAD